jgi:Fuc2NAc and GlcNAc transferase
LTPGAAQAFDALAAAMMAFIIAWAGTALMRRIALARRLLDVPNARSSHSVPMPRGGGVAIVAAATCALLLLGLRHRVDAQLLVALLGGGSAIALVGFADDRRPVSPLIRLLVHFAAAIWTVAWLGGLPPLAIGSTIVVGHLMTSLFGIIAIVWALNLFNFMDGIDGIAASEALFITWGAALLGFSSASGNGALVFALAVGASCLGFLYWNWPPAKVFMGDVGSGYLGYLWAALAIACAREHPLALAVWTVLGGVFLIDATLTLLWRLARRERIYEAHRTHAYQWLARRYRSHARVTALVLGLNICWLLPCAWFLSHFGDSAGWILIAALLPVALLCWAAGSGRAEVC